MYIYFVTYLCVCEVLVVLKNFWRLKNKDKKHVWTRELQIMIIEGFPYTSITSY